jgi:hypothetical protein
VHSTISLSFNYLYGVNFGNGAETVVLFGNNNYPAITSLSTLPSLSNSNYNYQYYPNINLCSFIFTGSTGSSFSLGTFTTSVDQENFQIQFVYTFSGTTRFKGWFNAGSNIANYNVIAASAWTSTSFSKGTNLLTTNSWDIYTVTWSANYLTFP